MGNERSVEAGSLAFSGTAKGISFSLLMGCNQMSDTRFSGCYVIVFREKSCWHAVSKAATENDLVPLLEEVADLCQQLAIPLVGVITDGQHSICNAVAHVLPRVPHQLCHFHYRSFAAKPVYEADKHAKKELKKHLRGVRPLERAVEKRDDQEAEAIRGYCLAVRSALTDDGRPPLEAPGLKLYERICAIAAELPRVSEKGACRVS